MDVPAIAPLLPQLASGAAHTHALGFTYESLDGDRVRIRVPWREDLVGDPDTGVIAGGVVTTLLDHVGGLAVWVSLDNFKPLATLDLRVDYMRAARPRTDLIAEARCYRLTRSIAFVRAWAFEDAPDDPVAAAQSAYILTTSRPERRPKPEAGGMSRVIEAMPYARFLGLTAEQAGDTLTVTMPFSDHLIGNPMLPALHGGSTAALLEITAMAQVAESFPGMHLPRPINVSVAYLRSGRPQHVYARARINKAGRRVAHVLAEAWQEDEAQPIAALTAHFLLEYSQEL